MMPSLRGVARIVAAERDILRDNRLAGSVWTRAWVAMLINKYYLFRSVRGLLRRAYRGYFERLPSQRRLIHRGGFDVLVILDACRFDVFEEVVWDYLDGRLVAARSPGSVTLEWLRRTWAGRRWDRVVYVSASPYVNRRGLIKEFDARRYFGKIVEVWDRGWDERLSTVPPGAVNVAVRLAVTRQRLRGRRLGRDYWMVVHYVQPHAPYVALRRVTELVSRMPVAEEITDIALRKQGRLGGRFAIDHVILAVLKEHLGETWRVNRVLRWAYVENLRWVLRHVTDLVTRLDARVVISADHGELLGEYGLYFHMSLPVPQLRVVPWFLVK